MLQTSRRIQELKKNRYFCHGTWKTHTWIILITILIASALWKIVPEFFALKRVKTKTKKLIHCILPRFNWICTTCILGIFAPSITLFLYYTFIIFYSIYISIIHRDRDNYFRNLFQLKLVMRGLGKLAWRCSTERVHVEAFITP